MVGLYGSNVVRSKEFHWQSEIRVLANISMVFESLELLKIPPKSANLTLFSAKNVAFDVIVPLSKHPKKKNVDLD